MNKTPHRDGELAGDIAVISECTYQFSTSSSFLCWCSSI